MKNRPLYTPSALCQGGAHLTSCSNQCCAFAVAVARVGLIVYIWTAGIPATEALRPGHALNAEKHQTAQAVP